jgi:endonuclease YncB( thermonuclease family)
MAKAKFTTKEAHRAAEDIAVHTKEVLSKVLKYTDALQQVSESTPEGRQLIEQAGRKQGLLYEAGQYFARLDELAPQIKEINLLKRFERAQLGIQSQGGDWDVQGIGKIYWDLQDTPDGRKVEVPRATHSKREFKSLDELVGFLEKDRTYSDVDVKAIFGRYKAAIAGPGDDTDRVLRIGDYIESRETALTKYMTDNADRLLDIDPGDIAGKVVSNMRRQNIRLPAAGNALKMAGAVAGGLALAGAAWSLLGLNPEPEKRKSLVSYDYEEWLAAQQSFSGLTQSQEGMSPGGVAAQTRKEVTDFGSPYRGIMGSQVVFYNQELLDEREKWYREQYQIRHFDPEVGLFGFNGIFKSAMSYGKGYNLLGGGTPVTPGTYAGVTGTKMLELDLSEGWKISADDADTITIKRGGLRGAVGSFFGLNRGYSIRMAGVDAPEIAHRGNAAQPMADESAEAFKNLLASKDNLKLLYDPTQSSYGRMMGVVIGDGENLNFEVIRRGLAGHLPYGKTEDAIIDYRALATVEQLSINANRGMWSQPYHQAFYQSLGRDRATYNTLTNPSKIAQNINLMDTVSLMETAQAQGMMNNTLITEASRIASVYKTGPDQVRPAVVFPEGAHYGQFMVEMQRDLASWTTTHGTGRSQNRFRARGGYGGLDKTLVLDSLGTTNDVWARRKYEGFRRYSSQTRIDNDRKQRMAAMQRDINGRVFDSPINHHRM